MAPLLTVIGLILGIAVFIGIDDIFSGHHYKSDAEKTEADRLAERAQDDKLHRIMWE